MPRASCPHTLYHVQTGWELLHLHPAESPAFSSLNPLPGFGMLWLPGLVVHGGPHRPINILAILLLGSGLSPLLCSALQCYVGLPGLEPVRTRLNIHLRFSIRYFSMAGEL